MINFGDILKLSTKFELNLSIQSFFEYKMTSADIVFCPCDPYLGCRCASAAQIWKKSFSAWHSNSTLMESKMAAADEVIHFLMKFGNFLQNLA